MRSQLIKKVFSVDKLVTWGLPTVLVPTIRFAQDKDKSPKLRKELFIRDFSSYAVGFGIYFASEAGVSKLMEHSKIKNVIKNIPAPVKKYTPIVSSVLAFCIWSGLYAPKFSKLIAGAKPAETKKNETKKLDITEGKNTSFKAKVFKDFHNKNIYRNGKFNPVARYSSRINFGNNKLKV